jgi:hypothetical protein
MLTSLRLKAHEWRDMSDKTLLFCYKKTFVFLTQLSIVSQWQSKLVASVVMYNV